jgi:hypothetical protein
MYVLINHKHHIIILLVYNFLAIMNKTIKIKKNTRDLMYLILESDYSRVLEILPFVTMEMSFAAIC